MNKLGCKYEAPTFGAHYPDGVCIDGYMWDLDSCDEPGGELHSGGDIPCPSCNTVEYLDWFDIRFSGNARQRRAARRKCVKKRKTLAAEIGKQMECGAAA